MVDILQGSGLENCDHPSGHQGVRIGLFHSSLLVVQTRSDSRSYAQRWGVDGANDLCPLLDEKLPCYQQLTGTLNG